MTEYSIYQINTDRDTNRVKFWDYDFTIKHSGGTFDFSIYDEVYYDVSNKFNSLDDIFMFFNTAYVLDFHGHSLSVSDVVEIKSSNTIEPGFYFCDRYSWRKVEL